MVIETLITPMKAEKQPWQMIFLGILFSSVAIMLAYWISPKHSSLMMVFFTTMACMPIMYNTIKYEESKDEKGGGEVFLLKEHAKALKVFMYLFIGVTISFSIWNVALSAVSEKAASLLFSSQIETITAINANVVTMDRFFIIFMNNLEVLFWCMVFSFVYGLGAIFILTWNASVIGAAIGNFIRTGIAKIAEDTGTVGSAGYAKVYSCAYLVRFLPHGIPEILAYFTAGLAGGIISVAIIRHRFGTKRFLDIVFDSADLLLISFVIIFIAGIIEVYFTPAFYALLC